MKQILCLIAIGLIAFLSIQNSNLKNDLRQQGKLIGEKEREVESWIQALRESEVRGNRLANDNRELAKYAGSLLSRQEQKKTIPQQKFVTRTTEGYDLPPLSPSPKEILEEADREWSRYTDQKIQRERNYLLREQIDNDNLHRWNRLKY